MLIYWHMKSQKCLFLTGLILALCVQTGCAARLRTGGYTSPPAAETAAQPRENDGMNAADTLPSDGEAQSAQFFAMDTVMLLTAYGFAAEEGLAAAQEVITHIEKLASVTEESSEIYWVNSHPGLSRALSEPTSYLLDNALRICSRTGGSMDISVYPIMKAWGFTTENYQVPRDETIAKLLESVDYTAIDYDAEANTVRLPEDVQIDLGCIAKGYAGDAAIASMEAAGVSSALISLGGNVQTLGAKPDGSLWRVAVQNPENAESYAGVLEVSDKAVITSGGYERFFVGDDGEVYWHIMDPATGRPAHNGLISVTVVGDSGMLCDALSTSLFVMGLDKASEHWREYSDFEAVFITEDHGIYITEGLENSFSALGDYANTNIAVIRK